MKCNYGMVLALSALILTTGCKKSINSSVDLSGGAKASFASNAQWQTPAITGRLVRYDIGDGNNSDCILSYDLGSGVVTLTKFSGTTSTTLSAPSIGFNTDNAGAVYVGNWNTEIADNFNEIGGVHIIAYDANGTGHEDHILLYIPGHGLAYLMHYVVSTNLWHVDWTNDSGNHTSGSGIGGYDLLGMTDKIIAYDYGSGFNNYLICYRPGYKILWVLQNNTTSSNPNPSGGITWTPRIQSNGGIGGYDLSNVNDQLVVIGGPLHDYMWLAAYRPGSGIFWTLSHTANNVNWFPGYQTYTGLNGFGLDRQDRVATGASGLLSPASVIPEDDMNMFCYRPGSGIGAVPTSQSAFYTLPNVDNPGSPAYITWSGINNSSQLLQTNPYGTQPTSPFDHVLFFSGSSGGFSNYNTNMLFYSPGASRQSQLYYLTGSEGSNTYSEVY